MSERLKAVVPLGLAVAVLTFVWLEVSLNFTFHWVTNGDLGIGLSLPASFHLVAPAAFISWAMFFAAGADTAAFTKATVSTVIGAVGGLVLMLVAPVIADLPDFWGIALVSAVLAFGVVLASSLGDWYFTPGVFSGFGCVVFWWIATGLDGWADGGGGASNTLKSLASPAAAGSGAFGGVLSTPVFWVFASIAATLVCGAVLGLVSVRLAGLLTPSSAKQPAEPVKA